MARDAHQLLVGLQCQPGVGDIGDQADLNRFASFFRAQILGQSLLLEAADAAPEVNLPAWHGQASHEGVAVFSGQAIGLAACRASNTQLGELCRTLDLILGLSLLNIQHGHAQVAVVVQRKLNHLLQARVREELLPGKIGSSNAAGVFIGRRIALSHRQSRAFQRRDEGAAAGEQARHQCYG